jgi:hypothetical protein
MGSPILTLAAQLECSHGGHATPQVVSTRVQIMQSGVLTVASVCNIAGCSLAPQAGGPCATAAWTGGATRVEVEGQPVLLETSVAMTAPPATPLEVVVAQTRVSAL